MGDKTEMGIEEFYGTGKEEVLDLEFRQLGRYLYNYEQYGESGLGIREKDLRIDFLEKGKNYLEQKKDVIVRELKNLNICEKINSAEFKTADKLTVVFISSVVAPLLGLPVAISMTIAEIIAIYGVEKYFECNDA